MKPHSPAPANQLNFEPFQTRTSPGSSAPSAEKEAEIVDQWSGEEELISLAEKLQSKKLPPLEAARGYWRLMQAPYFLSPLQISKALAQEPSSIQQALSLLALPKMLQDLLEQRELSLEHVAVLQRLRRDDDIIQLAHQAHLQKWSVETTEYHVNLFLGEIEKTEEEKMRLQIEKLLGTVRGVKEGPQLELDPLLPVWARLHNQASIRALADWNVQYKGSLRWEFNAKPATSDPGASRLRLAEWFRTMAEWLEGEHS